jgi:hypothetical protein
VLDESSACMWQANHILRARTFQRTSHSSPGQHEESDIVCCSTRAIYTTIRTHLPQHADESSTFGKFSALEVQSSVDCS